MPKITNLQEFFQTRGVIQELTPEVALKAVQGFSDELGPAAKADEAFYRQFRCPTCGSALTKEFLGGSSGRGVTWVDGVPTPQALLRCSSCNLLLNPRSGIIVEAGRVPVIPVDEG